MLGVRGVESPWGAQLVGWPLEMRLGQDHPAWIRHFVQDLKLALVGLSSRRVDWWHPVDLAWLVLDPYLPGTLAASSPVRSLLHSLIRPRSLDRIALVLWFGQLLVQGAQFVGQTDGVQQGDLSMLVV